MIVTHILDNGAPLCRFSTALPRDWPEFHLWTERNDSESATCAKCRALAGLTVTQQNYFDQIDSIYAVVSIDEGGEGIVAANIGGVMLPLIAADETRLKNILPFARLVATTSGKPMRLVKFTTREVIEEIEVIEGCDEREIP